MRRSFERLLVLGALLLAACAGTASHTSQPVGAAAFLDAQPDAVWSHTVPPINETHVFDGEINNHGNPVGFHSRPGGVNPANARVVRVTQGPNAVGVYGADVQIRANGGSPWRGKYSSLFPDAMSRQQVIAAILHAYNNRHTHNGAFFQGPSGYGFDIAGWLLPNGSINTAYPIYQ